MNRPDATFTVTVSPSFRVVGCAEKQEQESRGMFGFHNFEKCPNCQLLNEGWEFWGDNGHRQGGASTREQLVRWIKHHALKQWHMKTGGLMGYRFRLGSPLYYRG